MNKQTVILKIETINTRGSGSYLQITLPDSTKIKVQLTEDVQVALSKQIWGGRGNTIQIPGTMLTKER